MTEQPGNLAAPRTTMRAAWGLGLCAIAWLGLWIATLKPGSSLFADLLGAFLMLGAVPLLVLWAALVLARLTKKRHIGLVGWFAVPCVLIAATAIPWRTWQFHRAFENARPTLDALVRQHESAAPGTEVPVNLQAGPFTVLSVRRHPRSTTLVLHRTPDGEAGLVSAPSGELPPHPTWAVAYSIDAIDDTWWQYSWWDE